MGVSENGAPTAHLWLFQWNMMIHRLMLGYCHEVRRTMLVFSHGFEP